MSKRGSFLFGPQGRGFPNPSGIAVLDRIAWETVAKSWLRENNATQHIIAADAVWSCSRECDPDKRALERQMRLFEGLVTLDAPSLSNVPRELLSRRPAE